MGMSIHLCGIKPPTGKFAEMFAVYKACRSAKIDPPSEVLKFFGNEAPDPKGVIVPEEKLGSAVTEYRGNGESGFDIDLDKLDKDIRVLRFFNSW